MKQRTALLVGAGGMGRGWARNLHLNPDVRTLGWVGIRSGAAAAAIEKLQLPQIRAYENLEKALPELKPDFVVDVTVPEAHHDVTLASLAAGAHVLGEKPMADSMDRARAMVEASEKAGRLYMVSQSRRYDARALAFGQIIREQVGPLGILTSDFFLGPHFGGFRGEMDSVLLLDMAIHTFDSGRQISGCDPVSVYCEESNPAWSWYKGNASATAMFEMTGGLRYTYRGSWVGHGLMTSWQSEWRAYGPKGGAVWDGETAPHAARVSGKIDFFEATEKITASVPENIPSGIAGSLQEFLLALETGATPQGECHDNIKSLAMVFAAVESARSGKRIQVQA